MSALLSKSFQSTTMFNGGLVELRKISIASLKDMLGVNVEGFEVTPFTCL
ncbi:unnamed protein product [marine sediment metagenome]|uniref:Uncharacterized protein n=1 Tax=marine sediment metagenome TaxID=412755 RepID=X0SGH9_9ZZZZ